MAPSLTRCSHAAPSAARVLAALLAAPRGTVPNGCHTDYYEQLAAQQQRHGAEARHPLDYAQQ